MKAIIAILCSNDNRSYSLNFIVKKRQNNKKNIHLKIYTLSENHILLCFAQNYIKNNC